MFCCDRQRFPDLPGNLHRAGTPWSSPGQRRHGGGSRLRRALPFAQHRLRNVWLLGRAPQGSVKVPQDTVFLRKVSRPRPNHLASGVPLAYLGFGKVFDGSESRVCVTLTQLFTDVESVEQDRHEVVDAVKTKSLPNDPVDRIEFMAHDSSKAQQKF